MISLVYPQFSSTAVEPYAPRVIDSLLPLEEFTALVYHQVHQELFAASETTENIEEIPVVQEQVIVQEIRCGVPAMFQAASPVVEHRAPAPALFKSNACGGVYGTRASDVSSP